MGRPQCEPHQLVEGESRICFPVNIGAVMFWFCGQSPVTACHVPSLPRERTSTPARSLSECLCSVTTSHTDHRSSRLGVATIARYLGGWPPGRRGVITRQRLVAGS